MKTNNYTKAIITFSIQLPLFILLMLFCSFNLNSQNVSTYQFSSAVGTPVDIYNTGTAITPSTGAIDDVAYPLITMPFTFTYHGSPYTTVSASSNGFVTLGALASSTFYNPLQSATNTISGLGADLYANLSSANSKIEYKTTGTTPNRVFRIQYSHWGFYSSGLNEVTFQIALYETSNEIQVAYIAAPAPTTTSHTIQVGLTGAATTDFNDRATTTNWSASTAGTTNLANLTFSSTIKPATGLIYTWNAAAPCSGAPDATNVLSNAASTCPNVHFLLSLSTSYINTGISFQWQISANGTSFTNIAGATNATLYTTQTVANYYRCIITCSISGSTTTSSVHLEPMSIICGRSAVSMQQSDASNFNVYPNPAQSEFTLDVVSSSDKEINVVLFDILGNVVKQEIRSVSTGLTSLKTNIETFNAGMYFIKVIDLDNSILYSQRVIKE